MTRSPNLNKVAEVTLSFWIAKVIATTLGETAGDFVAQTLNLGYVAGFAITVALLLVVLVLQIRSQEFNPRLFWAAIVATTTTGTEVSDLMDRTLGTGYAAGSLILFTGLVCTLAVWYARKRTLSVDPVLDRDTEVLFWVAVVFSNSLGTAFGDALVDTADISYGQSALICSGVIVVVLALHYLTRVNDVLLFWAAFVFTRPFGAGFGDELTKPLSSGGLQLGTLQTSLVALVLLSVVVLVDRRFRRSRRPSASYDPATRLR